MYYSLAQAFSFRLLDSCRTYTILHIRFISHRDALRLCHEHLTQCQNACEHVLACPFGSHFNSADQHVAVGALTGYHIKWNPGALQIKQLLVYFLRALAYPKPIPEISTRSRIEPPPANPHSIVTSLARL